MKNILTNDNNKDDADMFPNTNQEFELRKRTPHFNSNIIIGENNNNNNNNANDNDVEFSNKQKFLQNQYEQKWYIKGLRKINNRWIELQNTHSFLQGDGESGHDVRIPTIVHPWIRKYKDNTKALKYTFILFFIVLILYIVSKAEVKKNVELYIRENEMIDINGNKFANGYDLKLADVYHPSLHYSSFDKWILSKFEDNTDDDNNNNNNHPEKKDIITKFSDEEFKNGYFQETIFSTTGLLFHSNKETLYNISMTNLNEALREKCSDTEICDCISLFQLGVARNVILVYNYETKEYNILYDAEISEQSEKRLVFKYSMEEEYHSADADTIIVDDNNNNNNNVDPNKVPAIIVKAADMMMADTIPKTSTTTKTTSNKKEKYFKLYSPSSILVQYKKSETQGKISREQFFDGTAACICNFLKIQNNYPFYLEQIEKNQEIKF